MSDDRSLLPADPTLAAQQIGLPLGRYPSGQLKAIDNLQCV
jgi:hypothetical protein